MKKTTAKCPIGKVVKLLGDSCSILIVRDLLERPRRFSELEENLSASSRTLAKKLKVLERERILTRNSVKTKGSPVVIRYELTKKGAAFHGVVQAMRTYGKRYL